jgi:ABC-type nickel/cobalt efflux system permease component RcnA
MSEGKRKSRTWIWAVTALGLLPLSAVMFFFGIVVAFPSGSDSMLFRWTMGLMLLLSPCVGLAGIVWIVVLCVRADRRQAARWNRNKDLDLDR